MAYSAQLRKNFKADARERIHQRFWPTMGAVILAMIPEGLITLIYRSANSRQALGMATISMLIYIAAAIFILPPITMGIWTYYVARARGQESSPAMVFQCFGDGKSYTNSIKIMFSIFVRSLGWAALEVVVMVPWVVLVAYLAFEEGSAQGSLWIALLVLSVLLIVVSLLVNVKIRRYDGTYIRMIDNPTQSAWAVSGECAQTFRGHNWELLVFDLSFILWALGTVITLGIVGIYTTAYMGVAFVNYFDALRLHETGPKYTMEPGE